MAEIVEHYRVKKVILTSSGALLRVEPLTRVSDETTPFEFMIDSKSPTRAFTVALEKMQKAGLKAGHIIETQVRTLGMGQPVGEVRVLHTASVRQ